MAIEPLLAELHAPTQVAWGTATSSSSRRGPTAWPSMIPGTERVTLVPDAMLFWPDEQAADLVPLLREFWEAHA